MNDHRYHIPSKFHGDRYPRTLNEAFGPHAELDIDSSKLPGTQLIPWGMCFIFAMYFLYRIFS